jgi:hypothetical protein
VLAWMYEYWSLKSTSNPREVHKESNGRIQAARKKVACGWLPSNPSPVGPATLSSEPNLTIGKHRLRAHTLLAGQDIQNDGMAPTLST